MRLNSYISIKSLHPNTGQIPGVPANPRQWTKGDVDRLARSIDQTPELLEARPVIVYPAGTDNYVILGGNLRFAACKQLKKDTVPCYIVQPDIGADKLKEIVIKDNGAFGQWDFDRLANEWDDLPLPDWGVPSWETQGLSTDGRKKDEDYQKFVDKFDEEIPVTTDDCYTPSEVYDIVRDFVDQHVLPLKGQRIIRPFYPGGDYKKEDYTGGVVIDNPPFSIYAEIVRWYCENHIPFFLFGPELTLFVKGAPVSYVISGASIRYENGALVRTSFVTNLLGDIRIWVEPTMKKAIAEAQKTTPTTTVYEYPDELITSGTLGKIANGDDDFILRKGECSEIKNLDGMKELDRGLFGGGFLISRAAAEKARAAAEKARAAAEKARAIKIELSARERAIVDTLDQLQGIAGNVAETQK
ncbi:MAG: ParB N-terminal domain-containing protein [Clostridia bacterium]|nr:ParB N-terminal domain-containing protein [Clostridia bacterium]